MLSIPIFLNRFGRGHRAYFSYHESYFSYDTWPYSMMCSELYSSICKQYIMAYISNKCPHSTVSACRTSDTKSVNVVRNARGAPRCIHSNIYEEYGDMILVTAHSLRFSSALRTLYWPLVIRGVLYRIICAAINRVNSVMQAMVNIFN
jgi:hypothetical protein